MTPIGRNDPCYCGSGKKYKHCHEAQDKAQLVEAHRWNTARQSLSRAVIAFAREKRFAESFAKGLELFWAGHYTLETADQMDEDEAIRFFDWFVFDYTPADRPRLLDIYAAEQGDKRDEYEKKILASWQTAGPASAYLVRAIEADRLHLQDIFDDSMHIVTDEAGAREAGVGELLLAHLVTIRDELKFSGATVRLPAEAADELRATMQTAFEEYRVQNPTVGWTEFLRAHSYLINRFGLKQAEKAGRPPVSGGQEGGGAQAAVKRAIRRIRK